MLDSSCITPLFHDCESPWCFAHLRRGAMGYNAGVKQRVRGHTTNRDRGLSTGKKIAFACAVFLLSLVMVCIGVAAIEICCGQWRTGDALGRIAIPRSIHLNAVANPFYDDPDGITYNRDQWALRGTFDTPADIDILCIGGSTTDERCVDDDEAWPHVLQESLRAAGHAVTVGNAGVGGQCTIGHIKMLRHWLPKVPGLHPRIIVFYVGINDTSYINWRGNHIARANMGWRDELRDRSAILAWWRNRAAVANMVRGNARMAGNAQSLDGFAWTTAAILNAPDRALTDALNVYQDRIAELCRLTREAGAEPVFVTQTTWMYRVDPDGTEHGAIADRHVLTGEYRVDGIGYGRALYAHNDAMIETAKANAAPAFDLARAVCFDDGDFYDFVHTKPSGSRRVGEYIAAELGRVLKSR